MAIMVGSARIDERGKISGGAAGDQKQTSNTNDLKGEVSQQTFYVHKKGWYILRPKSVAHARAIAANMITACNNPNIGYDQNQRGGVAKYGTASTVKTECDCSSLVRQCIVEATGTDPGNIRTINEKQMLLATGLFEFAGEFVSQEKTPVCNGDVLVTKTTGHTVVVTSGNPRIEEDAQYYPKYSGTSGSIVDALRAIGEKDTSFVHRIIIAKDNDMKEYTGTAAQNGELLALLKKGKLRK